jgi:hypothetical protein
MVTGATSSKITTRELNSGNMYWREQNKPEPAEKLLERIKASKA